jgi:pimeloyl-ACP methyl ester carboxylesterase
MTGNRDLTARKTPLARPAWLPESVWPFQTSAIEVEGSKIAITDVGQGPVLLFVHTGFWSFIWRDVLLRLAPDFRCICFDAPGTGRSDRLPAGSISLDRASRALTAIIRTLDLKDITLVVHDLGGPSGIAGAARVPDRIRGLCAVNAFAWRPSGIAFRGMLAFLGRALASGNLVPGPGFFRESLRAPLASAAISQPPVVRRFMQASAAKASAHSIVTCATLANPR